MSSYGFLPSILQPTRITDFTSTLINNSFSNNVEYSCKSGNVLISFADHFTQFLSVDKTVDKTKPSDLYQRNYKHFNSNSFIDDVSTWNWNYIKTQDVNTKFDDF